MNTSLGSDPRTERDLAATLLAEISRSEQHFNTLEADYRKLASTWLLASFAAMGFVATSRDLPLPAGITIFVIALGTSLGVQLLGIIDLLAYRRLLLAYFLEGLRLENKNPELPQVRSNMLAQGSTGKLVRLFYLASSVVPLGLGIGCYLAIDHEDVSGLTDSLVAISSLLSLALCVFLMAKTPGKWIRRQIAISRSGSKGESHV